MAGASEGHRLAAQAEERIAREVTRDLTDAEKALIDARVKTAMTVYPLLKPIAEKHGVSPSELLGLHIVETRGEISPMGRESGAGATGPFQITEIARREFKPSAKYATQIETEADLAAQYLAKSATDGFSTPAGRAMTYIAGTQNVKNWGGGGSSGVGEQSLAYVPQVVYAKARVRQEADKAMKQYAAEEAARSEAERARKTAAAAAGEKAFREAPYTPMQEGIKGYLFGPSEEEAEASRQARNAARDAAAAAAMAATTVPEPTYTKYGYK